MTTSWLHQNRLYRLLNWSQIAGDAYIGLDFLSSPDLELTAEQRSAYRQYVRRGLELVCQLSYEVTRTKDRVERYELYPLIQKISDDLKLERSQDLQEILGRAEQEINGVLQSRTTRLEDSLKLFSSVSKTTSSEISRYR